MNKYWNLAPSAAVAGRAERCVSDYPRRLAAIPGAIGTLMLFGAQVGPDDAVKNLCKWPKIFFSAVPESCLAGINNFWFYVLAFGLLALAFGWFFWPSKKTSTAHDVNGPVPYSEWKNLNEIDLETAAAIWAGTCDLNNAGRKVKFRLLKQAVVARHLKAHNIVGNNVIGSTTVKPDDLKVFLASSYDPSQYPNNLENKTNPLVSISPAIRANDPGAAAFIPSGFGALKPLPLVLSDKDRLHAEENLIARAWLAYFDASEKLELLKRNGVSVEQARHTEPGLPFTLICRLEKKYVPFTFTRLTRFDAETLQSQDIFLSVRIEPETIKISFDPMQGNGFAPKSSYVIVSFYRGLDDKK